MLGKLESLTSPVGKQLFEAVKERIQERQNSATTGLLKLLDDPNTYEKTKEKYLDHPERKILLKFGRDLFIRLFGEEATDGDEANEAQTKETCKSLDDYLQARKKMKMTLSPGFGNTPQEVLNMLKKELAVCEISGERPSNLSRLYSALLTIGPTSTEAERCFSACGLFITNLRTRLNDETVDMLAILQAFFLGQEF